MEFLKIELNPRIERAICDDILDQSPLTLCPALFWLRLSLKSIVWSTWRSGRIFLLFFGDKDCKIWAAFFANPASYTAGTICIEHGIMESSNIIVVRGPECLLGAKFDAELTPLAAITDHIDLQFCIWLFFRLGLLDCHGSSPVSWWGDCIFWFFF